MKFPTIIENFDLLNSCPCWRRARYYTTLFLSLC